MANNQKIQGPQTRKYLGEQFKDEACPTGHDYELLFESFLNFEDDGVELTTDIDSGDTKIKVHKPVEIASSLLIKGELNAWNAVTINSNLEVGQQSASFTSKLSIENDLSIEGKNWKVKIDEYGISKVKSVTDPGARSGLAFVTPGKIEFYCKSILASSELHAQAGLIVRDLHTNNSYLKINAGNKLTISSKKIEIFSSNDILTISSKKTDILGECYIKNGTLQQDDWVYVEDQSVDGVHATFENGFGHYNVGDDQSKKYSKVKYFKDRQGFIHLRGLVRYPAKGDPRDIPENTTIIKLPEKKGLYYEEEKKEQYTLVFPAAANTKDGGDGEIRINLNTGEVKTGFFEGEVYYWISLDGISFRVE